MSTAMYPEIGEAGSHEYRLRTERPLTEEQHAKLDELSRYEPTARVVGWYEHEMTGNAGPILELAYGLRYLTPGGVLRRPA